MNKEKIGVVIYTRFSPRKKQKNKNGTVHEPESCEIQEGICLTHIQEKGYRLIKSFPDKDVSGKDECRPILWNAIETLEEGNILLVFKRDRLARNLYLEEMVNRAVESRGATIEAVSGDVPGNGPEQVMIRQVLASISEYERKIISLRTSFAMKQHQKNGKRMGRYAPYGWRIDPNDKKLLDPLKHEQEALEEIRRMSEAGSGPCVIAEEMNRTMPDSCRGECWRAKTITKIVERF